MTQVRPIAWCEATLNAQRGNLFLWVPICLAIGIGWYFSLRFEPGLTHWAALGGLALVLLALRRMTSEWCGPLLLALVLVISGAGLAKMRVERVAGPVLEFRYYGPIEGRVVKIDRSASDAVRLTLDRVVLKSVRQTPKRVRVSLHGDQPLTTFLPGEVLILTGHLSPPSGPAEPQGFDFQRHAWFARLGAVGYTRTPVLRAETSQGGLAIYRMRSHLSAAVQDSLPGETGAFAAAIMTGDRSGMSQQTLNDLRASNLAHLLAISGLHMGLLTGFVFATLRYGLALIPRVALRFPVKKGAACVALIVGAFYLALSGGNVATVRAYIMVAVMFGAILLDRRALTLRSVAIAALIVLITTPEALIGPGFQMSFAATTALVASFSALRRLHMYRWPGWVQAVANTVIASGVAGLATAPIAAAHFNQIAHFGLIANVVSVPLMGLLVMPAAVLAICLAPFGLWHIGLWIMDLGMRWILYVAHTAASQPNALSHVPAPHTAVLAILAMGALFALLWKGRVRWVGVPIAACAFVLWAGTDRAGVLVADSGALVGVLGAEGRVLSKPKGDGFVAGIWLENDGAPVPQTVAAQREGFVINGRVKYATLGGWSIVQVSGKTALADMAGCGGADILISNQRSAGDRPCLTLDLTFLRASGAVAFDANPDGSLRMMTARDVTGLRPWNRVGWNENVTWPRVLTAQPNVVAER